MLGQRASVVAAKAAAGCWPALPRSGSTAQALLANALAGTCQRFCHRIPNCHILEHRGRIELATTKTARTHVLRLACRVNSKSNATVAASRRLAPCHVPAPPPCILWLQISRHVSWPLDSRASLLGPGFADTEWETEAALFAVVALGS